MSLSCWRRIFQIDFAALAQALNARTKAIVINSPNNPSGAVYSEQTIRRLAGLLAEKEEQYGHPIYLVSDEPYREIIYDGIEAPFVPQYYENTIVCYSYSKSLSLPGERIGYVLVPPQAARAGLCVRAQSVPACSGALCGPDKRYYGLPNQPRSAL